MTKKHAFGALSFIPLAILLSGPCVAAEGLPPVTEGAWTVVVMPDTQNYVRNDKCAPLFTEITEWLVAQRDARNIKLVLHVGDIVDANQEKQWVNAKNSMKVLDGKIPYVLAVGNHDLGSNANSRATMLNRHFKAGDNPLNESMLGGLFKEGELENAWYEFECGGWKAIIFSLEFGPRKEVVDWANGVASAHPDRTLILVTHEFIDQKSTLDSADGLPQRTTPLTDNNPHKYGIAKEGQVHCGEELWDAFVSKHPNFGLVVNGHYKTYVRDGGKGLVHLKDLTSCHRSDPVAGGNVAHQMLFNAQWAPQGGHGWLRLLEFQPDGRTVQVRTYSPHLARVSKDPSQALRRTPEFEFTFEMPHAPAAATVK